MSLAKVNEYDFSLTALKLVQITYQIENNRQK